MGNSGKMNCEETNELLASYALSALESDEVAAEQQHLAGCRRHDEALAELQAVVERLPLAVEEREPPRELRARLLQAFDAEVATSQGSQPTTARQTTPSQRLHALRPSFGYLAAAALALVIFGLTAWNIALQFGDGGDATMVTQLVGAAGGGQVLYLEDDRIVVLAIELPQPPVGRAYQAWGIYESGPVSLGLVPSEGVTAFRADLSDARAIAISEEPDGGSLQPTTEPLVVAQLR